MASDQEKPGLPDEGAAGHAPEQQGDCAKASGADAEACLSSELGESACDDEEQAAKEAESEESGAKAPGAPVDPEKVPGAKPDPEEEPADRPMGLLDHLNELRSRLTKAVIALAAGFGICWYFVDPLFNFLMQPLLSVLPEGTHAQYTTLPEAFFIRMQIAFFAGAFLMSPAIFYQIWAFVAPGLYEEEKRYILPIAFFSAVFFVAGGVFCYYIVFPFAFSFFISYSTPEIVITPKVSDYLSFTLKLLFAFGIIFEMPIFTLFLARLGIVTAAMMKKGRRYAIVGIFILAAILTPPDVVSQLLMACPMLLLYEISIWVAAIFGRKKKSEEKADADGETDPEGKPREAEQGNKDQA